MTDAEAENLGKKIIHDLDNPVIRSFAAEMIGESYPLSPTMVATVFDGRDVKTLGRRFAKWVDR